MPNTNTDLLDMIFDLADMAGRPQCFDCVYNRTGEAGTLDVPPRDSGDLDPYAVAACDLLLRDADLRSIYIETQTLTPALAVTRLRIVAYVASVLMPPVVEDYEGRYAVVPDEDGFLPDLDLLDLTLSIAVTRLRSYLSGYDSGQWVDPNAVAGAVVDVHDAALAVQTWWALTTPPARGSRCSGGDRDD